MAKRKKRNRGGGVPFNPDVDTGTKRPVTARVAVGDVNDKFSDYPSNGLTPRRLARIFREADEGNVRAQMELFEEMEEKDTHLFSQMQTRKLAVTGLDWEVQPFSEDEIDKEIADFIDEQLKGIENFDEVLIDMLDAIGKGISIMELAWTVEDGRNVIEDIEYVHPKKLVWDSTTDELKVCTREYPSGVELPENKFVVHKYKAKSGHASRAGIMRVVSWMYLFKNYDIKDWVSFCEVFGMPLRLGKYDASASESDKKQLMEAIISLGTDAAGIVPSSTMIEFIESQKTTSVEIYEKLARYCDEQISKKDLFVIDRKSGINTIAEVNSSWGIKNPFFFQKKVFYWGTKEEQKEIYVLEEGETILSLNKYGDLWEAETIAIPWIHHSQEVEVQHSKYSGIVTVEKTIVRSDDTGAVHMYIYFAGGEKDV